MELLPLYQEILPLCRAWYKEAAIFSSPALSTLDEALQRSDAIFRLIHDNELDSVVGLVALEKINWIDQTCEIMATVAEGHRDKTFATAACALLLEFAKKELNLRKVLAPVLEGSASERVASRLGFEVEGVLQKHVFNHGEYKNIVIMGKFLAPEGK